MDAINTKQGGFIKTIVIIVILLAILSYFKFNVKTFIESDSVRSNFGYVWDWCAYLWNTYLAEPAKYIWNDVFVDLIWEPSIDALKKIKGGGTPSMIENAPSVDLRR